MKKKTKKTNKLAQIQLLQAKVGFRIHTSDFCSVLASRVNNALVCCFAIFFRVRTFQNLAKS